MKEVVFTVEQGLAIQAQHLREWKARLSALCYKSLVAAIKIETESRILRTGADVPRGNDLTDFVASWRP
jgi:hypothetical protein